MSKIHIIAEAGVNHNGDPELAHALVESAADAGADMVKFQTFRAADVLTGQAPKATYQARETGSHDSQLDMVKKLELAPEIFLSLHKHCRERGIQFLSTPFDLRSIEFLTTLDMPCWKIPSGEVTNLPYLRKIGTLQQHVYLSTGMCTLGDVESALSILEQAGTPKSSITLLHCTTEYPAPLDEVNLRAMLTIAAAFPGIHGVGYSDHTQGAEIALAAAALGACVIEKHFTLDRGMEGPDHAASLEPHELTAMIRGIRNVEKALGDGIKRPTPSELPNRAVARKSLVAACSIKAGEIFTEGNMAVKRPGTGVSPLLWDAYLGKPATRAYQADELL